MLIKDEALIPLESHGGCDSNIPSVRPQIDPVKHTVYCPVHTMHSECKPASIQYKCI